MLAKALAVGVVWLGVVGSAGATPPSGSRSCAGHPFAPKCHRTFVAKHQPATWRHPEGHEFAQIAFQIWVEGIQLNQTGTRGCEDRYRTTELVIGVRWCNGGTLAVRYRAVDRPADFTLRWSYSDPY